MLVQILENDTAPNDGVAAVGMVGIQARAEIIAQFQQVAAEHHKTLASLTDDIHLLDTGLDSLCFAVVVARLEDQFGTDPFSADADVSFPVTFGDFVRLYACAKA